MKIVFTDLDGTILNSGFGISKKNLEALNKIKENKSKTVFVTGRNLFSSQKVLKDNLPVDYLIYSTGTAISNFKSKELIQKFEIDTELIPSIIDFLISLKLNFFIHKPAPNNHYFYYNYSISDSDFEERFKLYSEFSKPIPSDYSAIKASQFVIVLPYNIEFFENTKEIIKRKFPSLSYIRATSPLNHSHIWLEIYPQNVSKGKAVELLCNYLNESIDEIIAIGNDYNDLDMLEIAGKSFVVENAPDFLKSKFEIVPSNDDDGFAYVIDEIFK